MEILIHYSSLLYDSLTLIGNVKYYLLDHKINLSLSCENTSIWKLFVVVRSENIT